MNFEKKNAKRSNRDHGFFDWTKSKMLIYKIKA